MMTRDQLLSMYSQYPQALAAEVARVLRPLKSDEDRIQHNVALGHISSVTWDANAEQLYMNVADALLRTARTKGDTTG